MNITLNGIEIEISGDATVKVSEDGKSVKISMAEAKQGPVKVIEKIRVVETPGPAQGCTLPHWPQAQPIPLPSPKPWPYRDPQITWTTGTNSSSTGNIKIR